MDKKGKRRKVRWERGEREERGRHERRDRRAGGGGRSNKAINRDLGIGRQGPGLASLSTPRRAIWLDSINSFYQEVPSTLATLDCCLNRLAWILLFRTFQCNGSCNLQHTRVVGELFSVDFERTASLPLASTPVGVNNFPFVFRKL